MHVVNPETRADVCSGCDVVSTFSASFCFTPNAFIASASLSRTLAHQVPIRIVGSIDSHQLKLKIDSS